MTRTVLITGGNKGIGRACAATFAKDGHRVVVTGRDREALDRVARDIPGVEAIAFDVTDEQAWADLDLGVDILVANAGIAMSAPIHRTSVEQWHRVQDINVLGVFLAARAVVPRMKEQGWGRIVAVASTAGTHGLRYGTAYSASKHAVLGLIRSIATEMAATGVTANSVCPAFVDTEMTDRSVSKIVETTGRSPEDARKALEQMQPLGRLVTVDEVAAAVAYFASDAAAAVNGQSLILDGGGVQQ